MDMCEEAFSGLWPGREISNEFSIKYSGKFKGYNANVSMRGSMVTFNLSKKWRGISRDIKIGLLQELLARLLREKKATPNIDLYHIFLKRVHIAIPKTRTEPELEESFDRVNNEFFSGIIEKPNLKWNNSSTKLGSYDYGSDMITISMMLKDAEREMIDYVMYHEMLHKKHKFSSKEGRLRYHTSEFRSSESAFPNSSLIESRLRSLRPVAMKKISRKKPRFEWLKLF